MNDENTTLSTSGGNFSEISQYKKMKEDLRIICTYIDEGYANLSVAQRNLLKIYSVDDVAGDSKDLEEVTKKAEDIRQYIITTIIPEIDREISLLMQQVM